MEVRGVCVVSVLSMLFVCVCLSAVCRGTSTYVYICHNTCVRSSLTLCVSELRTHKKIELFLDKSSTYIYIYMSVSRFCSLLLEKQSGTRTFHDGQTTREKTVNQKITIPPG